MKKVINQPADFVDETMEGIVAAYGDRVQVWCSDLKDGDDWFFLVDAETDLRIFDRVQLVVNANGTPDNFSDDTVEDVFWSCCSIDD